MTRHLRTLPPALLLSLAFVACKQDPPPKPPDEGHADPDPTAGEDEGAATEPTVPQEPDPPEIAKGRHEYLLGHYQPAVDVLAPVLEDTKAREQLRASGLAGAWLALAHAQMVFEDGAGPAQHAADMAEQIDDPEVDAAAKLARGALLVAEGDFEAAEQSLEAAVAADPTSPEAAVANVLLGEAYIGSAFGSSSKVENPEHLDKAKAAYNAGAAIAKTHEADREILLGRIEEGLAAVADYQREKEALCGHAFASIDHYKAAGASDDLVQGPTSLSSKYKCKP